MDQRFDRHSIAQGTIHIGYLATHDPSSSKEGKGLYMMKYQSLVFTNEIYEKINC